MEQAPGHGSHLVEKLESNTGLCCVHYTRVGQEAKEGINLLGRTIGDPPMTEAISTRSTVALAEIGSDYSPPMNDPEVSMPPRCYGPAAAAAVAAAAVSDAAPAAVPESEADE